MEKNEVQEAMFLTAAAWYQGILNGNLLYASKAADRALQIKRRLYIENDARIAESHYVNAMIRMFQGKYEEQKLRILLLFLFKNKKIRKCITAAS